MRGSKRATPRSFQSAGSTHETKRGKLPPLREGFAIPRAGIPVGTPAQEPCKLGGGRKPYGRGSAALALAHIANPKACSSALRQDVSAETTKGPTASRRQLWQELACKAGFGDPFRLEPDMIFQVMGALKLANFRSAQLYLDTAKSQHIAAGYLWSDQLQQCYRAAVRSCNRHLGNPKQAAPLPLAELSTLQGADPIAKGGPRWPARSALLASWWLLREIEASNAIREHITVNKTEKKIEWRLPCSKTDWRALGATRSHTCSCELAPSSHCPYHNMVAQLECIDPEPSAPVFPGADGYPATKSGWADTFEELGKMLQLPITYPNGARCFTGHTARATGAVHLASCQVELWRVQLFGRWGSQVFLQYIRDAPLKQLDKLALETSVHLSLSTAKSQLQDLLRRAEAGLSTAVACPTAEMLADCEAAATELAPPKPTDVIGEKILLMVLFNAQQWGVFGLVSNLGSIVLRLLFAPIEEIAYSVFSAASLDPEKPESRKAQVSLLRALLLLQGGVGWLGLCFGPSFSETAVRILYGQEWAASEAPVVLAAYCAFLFFASLNGIFEAFMYSQCSPAWVRQCNFWQVGISLVLLLVSWVGQSAGPIALVLANSLAMLLRAALGCIFAYRHLQPSWTELRLGPVGQLFCLLALGSRVTAMLVSPVMGPRQIVLAVSSAVIAIATAGLLCKGELAATLRAIRRGKQT
eukprot:s625_g4.t1